MNIVKLLENVQNRICPKFLIFAGEGIDYSNFYIEQIALTMNLEIVNSSSVKDVTDKLRYKPMFSNKNRLFVVKDDSVFIKKENLWENFPKAFINDYIILIYGSIDKRGKFFSNFKTTIGEENSPMVVFDNMSIPSLKKHIKKRINITDKEAETLVMMCDCNYTRTMLECDKVQCLYEATPEARNCSEVFKKALADKLIPITVKDRLFSFTSFVARRDVRNSFKLCKDLQEKCVPDLLIISQLYRTFKELLIVQGVRGKMTTENTGLSYGAIKRNIYNKNKYTINKLIYNLDVIRIMEMNRKTGRVPVELALDCVLIKIFKRDI